MDGRENGIKDNNSVKCIKFVYKGLNVDSWKSMICT